MGQLPASGASLLKGGVVELVLSLGKEPALDTTLPDFKGMTEEAADAEIKNLGLVGVTVATTAADEAPGTVAGQFPLAGTPVKAGSHVALLVSR